MDERYLQHLDGFDVGLFILETVSNDVLDLIEARRFDEAERGCRFLGHAYPDQIDSLSHYARLHEARGEIAQAVARLRQCLDFIECNPDGFDSDSRSWYRSEIERLERRSD